MHPTSEQIEAFDRGEIDEADASAIEDHLATCVACQARAAQGSNEDHLIRLIRTVGQQVGAATASPPGLPRPAPSGYELLEPIGRGGMGIVFKARQRALGRLVAFKQIRAGIDADPKELARFRTEAEAAARLAHPNIVQVFDVGQQDGIPYIAMELVEGGNLGDRLAQGAIRAVEAAALVETLAQAVQHAHEHGIIHRDLKPANILLTPAGTPRIGDFGLVKLEGVSGQTESGALLGTPRYMAPEQTTGRTTGAAVDIHALGAIFYECLTGQPPFQAVAPLALLDQIRSDEPVAPTQLQPGVPRDLQTICLKCLEKDPRRRYATAAALADDLGRFLRFEPIRARPIGPVARLGKWVRRRPHQAALAAVAALAVTAAFGGLLVHQARLRVEIGRTARAALDARKQKNRADANYQGARAAIQAILDCNDDPAFATLPRRTELARGQAEKALIFYDRLLENAESLDPVVQLDTARAAREAATCQFVVGKNQEAVASLERSVRLLDAALASRPDDPEVIREQVQSRTKLGLIVWNTLKTPDRALTELRRAAADAERLVRFDPQSVDYRSDLAWCLHDLGEVLLENHMEKQALAVYRRAIEINRKLIEEQPADLRRRGVLAENLNNLGLLTAPAEPDRADAAYSEAAAQLDFAMRENPSRRCVISLSSLLSNWGNLAVRRGRTELAFQRFERGLALVEDVLKREPADTFLRYSALNLHGSRANLLALLGRHAEAVADWDRVIELNDEPADRTAFRLSRIMALVRTNDYPRGIAEAQDMTRTPAASNALTGGDLYNFACIFGLAAAAARDDNRLDPSERQRLADSYADTALDSLERAAGLGFFIDPKLREHARQDPDLAPLRGRAEFSKLVRDEPK